MMGLRLAAALMGFAVWSSGAATAADTLDPAKPEDAILIAQKMSCGTTKEGVPHYTYADGGAFSRLPGEKDKKLFYVRVLGVTQCKVVNDDKRGRGYRSVHREVLFYYDPETKEMLRTWENPWTGETVDVQHVANDPVNMRAPRYTYDENGKARPMDLRIIHGFILGHFDVPLFYKNVLGGEYQDYIGGTYHAMESFQNFYKADEVLDANSDSISTNYIGWFRFSNWLPWMKMGDRTGLMFFTAKGSAIDDLDMVPEDMIAEIKANYPIYLDPPPADDDRPNQTSWMGFKAYIDAQREAN